LALRDLTVSWWWRRISHERAVTIVPVPVATVANSSASQPFERFCSDTLQLRPGTFNVIPGLSELGLSTVCSLQLVFDFDLQLC